MTAAHFNEDKQVWEIKTNTGDEFTVRYLVTAIGILHKAFTPDYPGLDKFKGTIVHSSQWNPEIQYENKRVGVIGSGASGVQVSFFSKIVHPMCFDVWPKCLRNNLQRFVTD